MANTETYLNLITAQFRDKPKFTAMVSKDVAVQVQVQDLMVEMIALFDVDIAIGGQLDIIGQWVGFSRTIPISINGVYFAWDDVQATGWEYGIWQDPEFPNQITVLPDDVYRNFIKAKIAANHWDGTTDGMYDVWESAFSDIEILVQDNLDMSYNIAFVGAIVDSLTSAVIVGGYLPLKPEGVRIAQYLFPVNDGPIFGWDLDNTRVQGWDVGSWPRVELPT